MTSRSRRTLSASLVAGATAVALVAVPTGTHAAPSRAGLDPATARSIEDYVKRFPGDKESNRPPDGACRGTSNAFAWGVGPIWTGKTFYKGMVVNRGLGNQTGLLGQVKRIGKRTWKIDYQPMTVGPNVAVDILHKKKWGYTGEIYAWGMYVGDFQLHCPKSMMKKKPTKSSTTKKKTESTSSDSSRSTDSSRDSDSSRSTSRGSTSRDGDSE